MKHLKSVKLLAAVMAAIFAISACGESKPNQTGSKADTAKADSSVAKVSTVKSDNTDSKEKVELRFLLWGNQKEIEYKTKWTDEFNATHDNIHVNLEAIPEGFHDKLTVQVSSNTLADLVQIAGDFGGEYF